MDLNQLLFEHQVALMRCTANSDTLKRQASFCERVRHYETRILNLRKEMGVAAYPLPACP